MAIDLTAKKLNFVSRLTSEVIANADQINRLVAIYTECLEMGYIPDLGNPDGSPITDADLNTPAANGAPAPFPHLSAATLKAAVESLAAVKDLLDSGGHTINFARLRP